MDVLLACVLFAMTGCVTRSCKGVSARICFGMRTGILLLGRGILGRGGVAGSRVCSRRVCFDWDRRRGLCYRGKRIICGRRGRRRVLMIALMMLAVMLTVEMRDSSLGIVV